MKRKGIGLCALCGLYAVVGAFGIYVRAAEPLPPAPARLPAVAPGGGLGKGGGVGPPGAVGQIGQLGGLGKMGGCGGIGGLGIINGAGHQLDLHGKEAVGIEDGPTQVLAATTPAPAAPAKEEFVNPKVEPGKVKWHADFDTACKAAAKSGKPVLLFQMMGKLDDQFC